MLQPYRTIQQYYDEIAGVKVVLGKDKFKNFVEIGSAYGGSLWLYANMFCEKGAKVTVIDPRLTPMLLLVVNTLKDKGYDVQYIQNNSNLCEGKIGQIDLLHIDGDHSYEGVSSDFNLYYPKLKSNGYALLHDTISDKADIGITKFRKELENRYSVITVGSKAGISIIRRT